MRALNGRVQQLAALRAQMLAVEIDAAVLVRFGEQPAPDVQEVVGDRVARVVIGEEAIAF